MPPCLEPIPPSETSISPRRYDWIIVAGAGVSKLPQTVSDSEPDAQNPAAMGWRMLDELVAHSYLFRAHYFQPLIASHRRPAVEGAIYGRST